MNRLFLTFFLSLFWHFCSCLALQMSHSYYDGMHKRGQQCVVSDIVDWFHVKWDLCVRAVFYRVYQRQGRPEKALSQCERALELLQEGAHLSQICCVYRNMAAIEQAQGHLDRATWASPTGQHHRDYSCPVLQRITLYWNHIKTDQLHQEIILNITLILL